MKASSDKKRETQTREAEVPTELANPFSTPGDGAKEGEGPKSWAETTAVAVNIATTNIAMVKAFIFSEKA